MEKVDAAAVYVNASTRFTDGGMFGFGSAGSYSITNLGKVENGNIRSMLFIPPALTETFASIKERYYEYAENCPGIGY